MLIGCALIGKVTKLSARIEIITRWPLTARKMRVASRLKTWLMAAVWPCDIGSKKAAKPSPMVIDTICPAISTTENITRMTMPMARPIIICCTTITSVISAK